MLDKNGNNYSYQCTCGGQGWVDVGEGRQNRYPCRECYLAGRKAMLRASTEKGLEAVGTRLIPLNPRAKGKYAIVDEDDYERLSKYSWSIYRHRGGAYAGRKENGKVMLMHRVIMDCPDGMEIDHRDGQQLHNRKSNLRICSHRINSQNRGPNKKGASRYKGVTWNRNRWQATIKHNGRTIHLGRFLNDVEAAQAYDAKAKALGRLPHSMNFQPKHKVGA